MGLGGVPGGAQPTLDRRSDHAGYIGGQVVSSATRSGSLWGAPAVPCQTTLAARTRCTHKLRDGPAAQLSSGAPRDRR